MNKKEIVLFALWSCVLAVILAIFHLNIAHTRRVIPDAVCLCRDKGLEIQVEDYCKTIRESGLSTAALTLKTETFQTAPFSDSVNTHYVSANYGQFLSLELIKGAFFADNAGDDSIVISDELARKCFYSVEVIGRQIHVGGRDYRICGVYRQDRSLASAVSHNALQDVYLPLAILPETDPDASITEVYLAVQDGQMADNTIREFFGSLGKNSQGEGQRDYRESKRMIVQNLPLVYFTWALAAAVCLLILAVQEGKRFCSSIIRLRERHKFLSGSEKRSIAISIASIVLAVCVAFVLIRWASFRPFIPTRLLPNDYIFNLNHYYEQFVAAIQAIHGSGYHYMENYAMTQLILCGLLSIVSVIIIVVWSRHFFLLLQSTLISKKKVERLS